MKSESKIRRLLGNEYHLYTSIKFVNSTDHITEWKLFKKYNDSKVYFSKDNKPIMDSKHNTEKELLEFAKIHHKIDEHRAMGISRIIILWLVCILSIINIFISKKEIRYVCLTIDLVLVLETIISYIIWEHNWEVDMRIHRENFRKLKEQNEQRRIYR